MRFNSRSTRCLFAYVTLELNLVRSYITMCDSSKNITYSNTKIEKRDEEYIPAHIWKIRVARNKVFSESVWTLNCYTAIDRLRLTEFDLTCSSARQRSPSFSRSSRSPIVPGNARRRERPYFYAPLTSYFIKNPSVPRSRIFLTFFAPRPLYAKLRV